MSRLGDLTAVLKVMLPVDVKVFDITMSHNVLLPNGHTHADHASGGTDLRMEAMG